MKLGIMHPRQSKVVASLRESGLGVPEAGGWSRTTRAAG